MSLAIEKTKELNQRLMADYKREFKSFPSPQQMNDWAKPRFKAFFDAFTKEELVEVAVDFNIEIMMEAFRAVVISRLRGL